MKRPTLGRQADWVLRWKSNLERQRCSGLQTAHQESCRQACASHSDQTASLIYSRANPQKPLKKERRGKMSNACRNKGVIADLGLSPYLPSTLSLLSSDTSTSLAGIILYLAGTVTFFTTHQGAGSRSGAGRISVKNISREVLSYQHLEVSFVMSKGLHDYQYLHLVLPSMLM